MASYPTEVSELFRPLLEQMLEVVQDKIIWRLSRRETITKDTIRTDIARIRAELNSSFQNRLKDLKQAPQLPSLGKGASREGNTATHASEAPSDVTTTTGRSRSVSLAVSSAVTNASSPLSGIEDSINDKEDATEVDPASRRSCCPSPATSSGRWSTCCVPTSATGSDIGGLSLWGPAWSALLGTASFSGLVGTRIHAFSI